MQRKEECGERACVQREEECRVERVCNGKRSAARERVCNGKRSAGLMGQKECQNVKACLRRGGGGIEQVVVGAEVW